MALCLVALVVFSVMSVGSAKYKKLARNAFRCFVKTLTLSPCDVGLEQRIKGKITAKLLSFPRLADFVYRNFKVISWLFTLSFFASWPIQPTRCTTSLSTVHVTLEESATSHG